MLVLVAAARVAPEFVVTPDLLRGEDHASRHMRVQVDGRTLRIIAGPAELGRREALELMAEELSSSGEEP